MVPCPFGARNPLLDHPAVDSTLVVRAGATRSRPTAGPCSRWASGESPASACAGRGKCPTSAPGARTASGESSRRSAGVSAEVPGSSPDGPVLTHKLRLLPLTAHRDDPPTPQGNSLRRRAGTAARGAFRCVRRARAGQRESAWVAAICGMSFQRCPRRSIIWTVRLLPCRR
jgi:hypothetical protein